MFQILLPRVLQGSILGPPLLRVFINDLFYFIKDEQLLNFADDNIIVTFSNSVADLITKLQKWSGKAVDWFRSNEILVNPNKFQTTIINWYRKSKDSYEVLTDNPKTDSENSVTLLDIEIDNKLNFEDHFTSLCQKVERRLNTLLHIHKYIGFQKWKCSLTVLYSQILIIVTSCGVSALPHCHKNRGNTRTSCQIIV